MKILTFDTSLDTMYVTLAEDENKILSKIVHNKKEKYHSAFLIPTIIELLQEKKYTMQDVDAIGVNVGPGSFTGIRACVTVARVIGQMLNIPVVGVPSLEIIAHINKSDKNTLCLMDARKNKAYMAIYSSQGDVLQAPFAIDLDDISDVLNKEEYFIVTDEKMQNWLKEQGTESVNYKNQEYDYGIPLCKVTYKYVQNGNADYKWHNAKPLYIQPPPISMPSKKKI